MIRNIFIVTVMCAMMMHSSALTIDRPRRSADTCGVPNSKLGLIVRGQNFPRGSFPWIVALMHTGTRPPSFFCAGTLISKTFVISAAHCILEKYSSEKVFPRDVLAIFGAHDLSDAYESGRIMQSPKKIFVQDDWNHLTESYDADMSLLEFWPNKIHFDDFIKPICLWNSENESTVAEGIVTGWGKSEDPSKIHENKPKMIKVPIQSQEECFLNTKALIDLSSKRTFCAGLRNGSGVCSGDSGGGLFIKVDEVYHLKGIVSSSLIKDGGCDITKNAVYTNVLKFKDWIAEKIGSAMVTSTKAVREVICAFKTKDTYCCGELYTCVANQTIDKEDYVIRSELDTAVKQFSISYNRAVKFLPGLIGAKFPNLKEVVVSRCGLTVVRNHYFKNLKNLERLHLDNNRITTIDSDSFKDLASVVQLNLNKNMIETLDEKLFATMLHLANLKLDDNKIKFLSPSTFEIPGRHRLYVYLHRNVCIDGEYDRQDPNDDYEMFSPTWDQLEEVIKANCSRQ